MEASSPPPPPPPPPLPSPSPSDVHHGKIRVAGNNEQHLHYHHKHEVEAAAEDEKHKYLHHHHHGAEANRIEEEEKLKKQPPIFFSRHYSFQENLHPHQQDHHHHHHHHHHNHHHPQQQEEQQQQRQQQQHTFSRHASFNLPPKSKPFATFAIPPVPVPPPPPPPSFLSFSFSSSSSSPPSSSPSPSISRMSSFQDPKSRRALDRIVSIDRHRAPEVFSSQEDVWKGQFVSTHSNINQEKEEKEEKKRVLGKHNSPKFMTSIWSLALSTLRSGKRSGPRKLLILIFLNFTYSFVELFLGLLSGRIGLVSDAFHLTFGCGLLSFSFIAMLFTKRFPDEAYTYGYKRLEVLAAFTNALFLLFLSFSLAVEALHAFVHDESVHKHYLIVSAVTNLFVNLVGVWFFRGYARIRIAYRKAEDMNYHSIFLHVLADSIRSAGLILASWLLTLGVSNAETLCLGLVAVAVFLVVMPLFKATAGILLQMSPQSMSASMLHKCQRQVILLERVLEMHARFWEMVPGFVVGTILVQVKEDTDEQKVLQHVHSVYNDIGIKDLTVQLEIQV